MEKPSRQHSRLGRLRWDAGHNSWRGEVKLTDGYPIRVSIHSYVDWEDDAQINLAAKGIAWACKAELRIRELVADGLLDLYNREWADEDPEVGMSPMNRDEFLRSIRLTEIELNSEGRMHWEYSCGNMFGGQVIWLGFGSDRELSSGPSVVKKYEEEDESEDESEED